MQNEKTNIFLINFLQQMVVLKINLQRFQEAESDLLDIIKIVKGLRGACFVDPLRYLLKVYAQLMHIYEQ